MHIYLIRQPLCPECHLLLPRYRGAGTQMRGPRQRRGDIPLAQATLWAHRCQQIIHEGPDPGREVTVLWIEGVEGAGSPAKGSSPRSACLARQRLGCHEMVRSGTDRPQPPPSPGPPAHRQAPAVCSGHEGRQGPLLVHELPGEGATRARGDELDQIMLRQHLQGGWRGAAGGIIGVQKTPRLASSSLRAMIRPSRGSPAGWPDRNHPPRSRCSCWRH